MILRGMSNDITSVQDKEKTLHQYNITRQEGTTLTTVYRLYVWIPFSVLCVYANVYSYMFTCVAPWYFEA